MLVIGAQRCGTTYLSAALDAHPQITMARPARPEPKVFCDDDLAVRGTGWYHRTWFGHAADEQVLGDKSTSYLEDPAAPARAVSMLGNAVHVVAVLRDPVERAVSNWRFSSRNGLETRAVEDALLADLTGRRSWDAGTTSVSPYAYLRRGRYAEYLDPWWSAFGGTTHVLFMEELLTDPAVLTGLVHALGVDPDLVQPPAPHPLNSSEGSRPVLSRALLGTLKAYFEESNAALSAQTGRQLPW